MPMGQSFQERNASFEHMYAPSRAKELFKRHKEIDDYAQTQYARLTWEKKTRNHELQKNITMFQRRKDVLYQKLKEVEDRYFAEFGKQEEFEEEDDDDDDYRPATHTGVYESHKRISLDLRPVTSHPALITTPKQLDTDKERPVTAHPPLITTPKQQTNNERPGSAIGSQTKSRPTSAAGSLPKSRNASRPSSGLKHRATTASGVRFALDDDNEVEDYYGFKPLPVERPKSMTSQTSRFLSQRARRKSVFALTKAKQYELRNEGFKEDNEILQEELRDKIDDFLERVDKFKEDYKKSQDGKKEHPKASPRNVTSTEDISGHNKMSDRFQVKLVNPYANTCTKTYSLTTPNPQLHSKSNDSIKSDPSVKSPLHQKSDSSLNNDDVFKSTKQPERAASCLSSTSIGAEQKPINRHAITRTLSIASRVSSLSEGRSKEEMMKERLKLLYLDAHGELEDEPIALKDLMKKTPKKQPQQVHRSNLVLNTQKIEKHFEEFMDSNQDPDDLKKLIAHAAKLKHRVRKHRDKSIVPFMAARRAIKLWKNAANIQRAKEAFKATQS